MRGTLAGAFSAGLALIVLHTVATSGGSGRISAAFRDVNTLLEHLLDPSVPAIPDLRGGVGDTGSTSGSTTADGRGYVRTPGAATPAPSSKTPSSAVGSTAARYNLGRVGGL